MKIRRRSLPGLAAALLVLLAACATPTVAPVPEVAAPVVLTPPRAAQKPYTVESPNGGRSDPYYWLRDDSRKSPEVLAYLNAENAYKDALLAPLRPLQEQLYKELVGRIQQDDSSVPVLDHGYWYYTRYEAGQEYPVYARRRGTMEAPEQVMLDGNALAQGHDYFQIGGWEVSPDSKLLAYAEDTVGRRQYTLRVKNLDSGALLADTIVNVEPGIEWANDNRTLLYIAKDPVTLLSVRVHKHALGADPAKDPLVYEEKDGSFYMGLGKSKSGQYLFINLDSTLVSEWRYADAADPKLKFRTVLPREPNHEYTVEQLGKNFIIRSNWQAPNFRIVSTPIASSADKKTWKELLPNRADALIENFEVFRNCLVADERSGGLSKLRVLPWKGDSFLITSDEPAYTSNLVPTPNLDSENLRYVYTSLVTPHSTYDYNLKTGKRQLRKAEAVLGGFDTKNYITEYLHAKAGDGTLVPVSIAYRRGLKRDGSAPLYQYSYGSYGISTDPAFRGDWVSLMDRGFVVATAHIRGGEELGRQWYEDGKLLHKKNTFNDFVAVTDFLVAQKYVAKDKVFAVGRSAGGLLMGAVANLAPEKYRGIVAGVPFVDVVTTMLDDSIPLTTNEFDEWGNPQQKVFYDYMLSYSPYDNVSAKAYPAMLVTTGLWDSQVQYYEPAKWVARLRATKTDDHPLILDVNMEAGHGGKSGRFQKFHETAQEYAFILGQLGAATP